MPIYEYQCEKCHEVFEIFQSMHDAPLTECQKCSGRINRLISRPAILFKGSGFHVTDYSRSSKGTSEPKPESKDASKPAPEKNTDTSKAPQSSPSGENKSDNKKS